MEPSWAVAKLPQELVQVKGRIMRVNHPMIEMNGILKKINTKKCSLKGVKSLKNKLLGRRVIERMLLRFYHKQPERYLINDILIF
jgi:hypothetical protein